MSDDDGGFVPPRWFSKAAALFGAGSATVAGVSLWDDPATWAIAAVSDFVINDVILGAARAVGGLVLMINQQIAGAFGLSGSVVLDGIGSVGGVILGLLDSVASTVDVLAASAGPFGLLVVILSWVVAGLLGAVLVRGAVETVRVAW